MGSPKYPIRAGGVGDKRFGPGFLRRPSTFWEGQVLDAAGPESGSPNKQGLGSLPPLPTRTTARREKLPKTCQYAPRPFTRPFIKPTARLARAALEKPQLKFLKCWGSFYFSGKLLRDVSVPRAATAQAGRSNFAQWMRWIRRSAQPILPRPCFDYLSGEHRRKGSWTLGANLAREVVKILDRKARR